MMIKMNIPSRIDGKYNPEYSRKLYHANKEKEQERSRKYYQVNRDKILERQRKYNKNNPEARRMTEKNHRAKYPERYKARYRANYHVSLGLYCETCGSTEDLQRHHSDYSKSLEIIFVCGKCHGELHRGGDK